MTIKKPKSVTKRIILQNHSTKTSLTLYFHHPDCLIIRNLCTLGIRRETKNKSGLNEETNTMYIHRCIHDFFPRLVSLFRADHNRAHMESTPRRGYWSTSGHCAEYRRREHCSRGRVSVVSTSKLTMHAVWVICTMLIDWTICRKMSHAKLIYLKHVVWSHACEEN